MIQTNSRPIVRAGDRIRGESQVIKLVNIFLDGLVSVGNDAGWEGDSFLSRVIEFCGEVPRSTGLDQSNLTMLNALRLYRDKHHDFPMISSVVNRLLKSEATRRHIMALLVRHYYHGVNLRTDKAYSEDDKLALWVAHLADMGDKEAIHWVKDDAQSKFRYGYHRAGPRLVRREAGI